MMLNGDDTDQESVDGKDEHNPLSPFESQWGLSNLLVALPIIWLLVVGLLYLSLPGVVSSLVPALHSDAKAVPWIGVLFGYFLCYLTGSLSILHQAIMPADGDSGYDVSNPRGVANTQYKQSSPLAARLWGSHLNANEDIALFAAAVACCAALNAEADKAAGMALLHCIARLGHYLTYAFGVSLGRAFFYNMGLFSNVMLFVGAIWSAWIV